MVQLLLECGADPNIIVGSNDGTGTTLLHQECGRGGLEVIRLLLDAGADMEATDTVSGRTALHYASYDPETAFRTIQLLLDRGAGIDIKDSKGYTPLHLACQQGNLVHVAELLLEQGANIEAKTNQGSTALHMCSSGDVALLLLIRCADLEAPSMDGCRPLSLACHGADF